MKKGKSTAIRFNTLRIRIERINANALALAEFLEKQPQIDLESIRVRQMDLIGTNTHVSAAIFPPYKHSLM
ncbi:hypothetical protein G3578_11560 [Brevibacillus sp. SYP-B805]|nr:hypothetical protein [Brevibacillus sp. SYP-B805]